jgi:hypothetical protein
VVDHVSAGLPFFMNGAAHEPLADLVERCMEGDERAVGIVFDLLEAEAHEPKMLVGPAPRRDRGGSP